MTTTNPKQPFREERLWQHYADFRVQAVSDEARSLVRSIAIAAAARGEPKQSRQPSKRGPYRTNSAKTLDAIERFVGHLLLAKADSGSTRSVAKSMSARSFTGEPVSYRYFVRAVDALKGLNFITHQEGAPRYFAGGFDGDQDLRPPGEASKFTATQALLDEAERRGVHLNTIADHFIRERDPLELAPPSTPDYYTDSKGQRVASTFRRGLVEDFPETDTTRQLRAEVLCLNEFLQGFTIGGVKFHGFFRRFNDGADPESYSWDKGGRLYAIGGSYQNIKSEERAGITINGEPTVEIDIHASHLTIYHSRLTPNPLLRYSGGGLLRGHRA